MKPEIFRKLWTVIEELDRLAVKYSKTFERTVEGNIGECWLVKFKLDLPIDLQVCYTAKIVTEEDLEDFDIYVKKVWGILEIPSKTKIIKVIRELQHEAQLQGKPVHIWFERHNADYTAVYYRFKRVRGVRIPFVQEICKLRQHKDLDNLRRRIRWFIGSYCLKRYHTFNGEVFVVLELLPAFYDSKTTATSF